MKGIKSAFIFLITINFSLAQITNKDELEAYKAAYNCYIWGFPIVKMGMEITQQVKSGNINLNQVSKYSKFDSNPWQDFQKNTDVLGAKIYFDLKNTGLIINVPLVPLHYYSLDINDAYSNNFGLFSSLQNPQKIQKILLIGPNHKGEIPKDIKTVIKSHTNMGWVHIRTFATSKLEQTHADKILNAINTVPFPDKNHVSDWEKRFTLPISKNPKSPINQQIETLEYKEYFSFLSAMLMENPVYETQNSYVADFGVIGVVPGEEFEKNKVKKSIDRGIKQGFLDAIELLKSASKTQEDYNKNYWSYNVSEGKWGNKYTKNAASAYNTFDQSPAAEFMKYKTSKDANNLPLEFNGKGYTLTIEKNKLPQTKAFWTIEILDSTGKAYSDKSGKSGFNSKIKGLKYQKNGSIVLSLTNTTKKGQEFNWVPVPTGNFEIIIKVYQPGENVASGEWAPPSLVAIK